MKKPKILLVDDIPENLFALEHLLQSMDLNCECVKAGSGSEALALIESDEFALVLLDIMMPEMDGYEVAMRIRERGLDKELPIVFITAETGPKPLDRFMATGAVGSLQKPIDPEVLERKVSLFLNIYNRRMERRE